MPKPKINNSSEIEHKAGMAAVYLSQGYSREAIASLLKPSKKSDPLSSSYISKLIKYALAHGMLKTYSVSEDKLPEEVRRFYEKENSLEFKLLECYHDKRLKYVHIVDFKLNGRDSAEDLAEDAGMVKLASIFIDSLLQPRIVGVSRGYTLSMLAATLKLKQIKGKKPWNNAVVFPATAEFAEKPSKSRNSSKLARILSKALTNIDPDNTLSLQNFESLFPCSWKMLHTLRANSKVYVQIFGKPKASPKASGAKDWKDGYAGQMDTLISSVSDFKKPIGGLLDSSVNTIVKELNKVGESKQANSFHLHGLSNIKPNWIIGDIAGSIVVDDSKNIGKVENNWLLEYNHRTNSINHDQINHLAQKADKNPEKVNGVVAIAITGEAKAPVIRSLLEQGLINRLFCDRDTAKKLVKICCP